MWNFLAPVTKRYVERKVLRTHPMHLFRIIQDVDSYSKFLPLCSHSKVTRKHDNQGRSFDATLTVGFGVFQEEYLSRVQVNPETWTVETTSIQSKRFDALRSRWKLGEYAAGNHTNDTPMCDVDFEVEMTVSDPIIAQILDQVLQEVAGRQVEAFEKRCREIPLPPDLISANQPEKQ